MFLSLVLGLLLLPSEVNPTLIDGVIPDVPPYYRYYPLTRVRCVLNCYVDDSCKAIYYFKDNRTCFCYDRVSVTYYKPKEVATGDHEPAVGLINFEKPGKGSSDTTEPLPDTGLFASAPFLLSVVGVPTPGSEVLIMDSSRRCPNPSENHCIQYIYTVHSTKNKSEITLQQKEGFCLLIDKRLGPDITKDCTDKKAIFPVDGILVNHSSFDLSSYQMYYFKDYPVCKTALIMDSLPNAFVRKKNENPVVNPMGWLEVMCRQGHRLLSDGKANFYQMPCQESGEWLNNETCVNQNEDLRLKNGITEGETSESNFTCDCGTLGRLGTTDKIIVTVFLIASYIIVAVAARK